MARYLAGIDIGGTFTDCVVVDDTGHVITAKSPSTPPEFSQGIVNALELAAQRLGLSLETLCRSLDLIAHGTTVGTNALIQKRGARVGLITTRGHEDCIHIMRGSRGLNGRDIRKVSHFSEGPKPHPIVPKSLIRGVSERIDAAGAVVAPINVRQVEAAVDSLVAQGVESLAICLLWSFKNPAHEMEVKRIVAERAPQLFVSCSSDLVPKWGEYERTTAVALNAYIGPVTARYLRNIDARLRELGYANSLQITQCGGGTISVQRAIEAPLLTLDSGPVAGVTGSLHLGALMNEPNIITTDMGGTSFDVGVIHDGAAAASYKSTVDQYDYFLPKVDIQAIGAGGGSIAWIDDTTRTLHVGPDSASSLPGPVCYSRGGTEPTVTDAAVVLGYLDPDRFAGGRMKLDREAAATAIERLGSQLGLSVDECAAGICRIVEFNMADIIRRTTVEKGHDPRDFVLLAFGGAGPAHAGVFGAEVEVKKVLIPQRKTASVWCAFGAAAADVLHVCERASLMVAPFDVQNINHELRILADQGSAQLASDGLSVDRYAFSVDLRHRGQINEVEVPVPGSSLSPAELHTMGEDFFQRYEALYGKGSSFRGARLEAVTFRCRVSSHTPKPNLQVATVLKNDLPANAARADRSVYWAETRERKATPVFDGDVLEPGHRIAGPAIVETTDTTVVVRPRQSLLVDTFGNFELTIDKHS